MTQTVHEIASAMKEKCNWLEAHIQHFGSGAKSEAAATLREVKELVNSLESLYKTDPLRTPDPQPESETATEHNQD